MFVVVAILAVPLGCIAYPLNWKRQRDAIRHHSGPVKFEYQEILRAAGKDSSEPKEQPPRILRLFGEKEHYPIRIIFGDNSWGFIGGENMRPLTEAERLQLERINRLFPEAEITAYALKENPRATR
jgi:hypothetical protein